MSNPSDSHSSEDSGLIKTPTQLIVVIVLAFVVPIAAIFTIIHFVTGDSKSRATPAMSDKAVAERIKPVGNTPDIEKGPSPLVPAPAPVVTAAASGADSAAAPAANGKSVYDASCQACHGAGVAGAPKLGDKTAWAPRIGTGVATLQTSAIKGKNAMPPKGGNLSLSDADVKAAVDYMVAQSK
ncbi:MAG: c-type cytochrome [Burkholderiales bacterium]